MPILDYRGIKVYYRSYGTKSELPTLLFIHGAFANHVTWVKQIQFFSKYTDLIVFDLPGHGKSGKPMIEYTLELFGSIVKRLIKDLDLQKPVLFGHSLGGFIAQVGALSYPELIDKLVLLCTGVNMEFFGINFSIPYQIKAILKWFLLQLRWSTVCQILSKVTAKHEISGLEEINIEARMAASCSGKAFLNILSHLLETDLSEQMKANKLPTLFITGTKDLFYRQANKYRALPNTLVRIKEEGEHILHLLNPEINLWILDFIKSG